MTSFQQLIEIVKKLRGPDGCPWDKEQTHKSLTPYAIEEAYELEEAIENEDLENMKEELGDLLFQTVLHSQIASETDQFDIHDVLEVLNNKMITRHPHVFSDTEVKDSEEVVKNWEQIKAQEKPKDIFETPTTFPALLRSHKIGKRTRKMDFDWDKPEQVLTKLKEEIAELEEAINQNKTNASNKNHIAEEMGDVLFTAAQMARHLDLDAEKTLRKANEKFIGRFQKMLSAEPNFESLDREKKEALWDQIKKV